MGSFQPLEQRRLRLASLTLSSYVLSMLVSILDGQAGTLRVNGRLLLPGFPKGSPSGTWLPAVDSMDLLPSPFWTGFPFHSHVKNCRLLCRQSLLLQRLGLMGMYVSAGQCAF